ncbi:Modification methylase Cfr9I [Candidatus Hydrogenisulfobacillus filiaventi]|uniref:Methyltransferase n=1 Tax=Candidatus Hydrogenisulfobacillus filiaventi TaxID=2707344 RepID=A0A6F8ZHP7_9FIRM|nr:Modification methylase Cfr9I [Candidatus Hydrogenisulfobacillus filiaventi]
MDPAWRTATGSALVWIGDAEETLRRLPDASVRACVTSPPYFQLRDYGVERQIGLEPSIDEYIGRLVAVFREVHRVLRDDGTLWVVIADTYGRGRRVLSAGDRERWAHGQSAWANAAPQGTAVLPDKQLLGVPWRLAFALQADGWILRSDIIWAKPAPLPESVRDRPTRSHEHVFLLAKSPNYYYDLEAATEPARTDPQRQRRDRSGESWNLGGPYKPHTGFKNEGSGRRHLRDVWVLHARGAGGSHYATFPLALAERVILIASQPGDVVLDPFAGSGTTLVAAQRNGRTGWGIELNPAYLPIIQRRCAQQALPWWSEGP